MDEAIKILTFDEVIAIHRMAITLDSNSTYTESDYNLLHRGSLEVVLNEITYPLYGIQRFPSVQEKASVLCWRIIAGHIFRDGNKRTGLICLMTMLAINDLVLNVSDDDVFYVALAVGSNEMSSENFADWVAQNVASIEFSTNIHLSVESFANFIINFNQPEDPHSNVSK
jgi:death on curing protein